MMAAMRGRVRSSIAAFFVLAVAAAPFAASAQQGPPSVPDFFWPYGRVRLDGADISPAQQPVIAFVGGQHCGNDTTRVATADDTTPAEDVGHTVYVVNVMAAGTAPGQAPGCGTPGAAVQFWFPVSGYLALQVPLFATGGQRIDLDLGTRLGERRTLPQLVSDGLP